MTDPVFGRRLKELVAGTPQIDVARRLAYTQSHISAVMRGARPSREFVERLVEAYELDREEWLSLAGYGKTQPPDVDAALERLQIAAERVTHTLDVITARLERPPYGASPADERETYRMLPPEEEETGRRILLEGMIALKEKHGRPLAISMDESTLADLTPEKARATLKFWDEQASAGII